MSVARHRGLSLAVSFALALALCACGAPDLEVRGLTARVVGETVKIELVQGDAPFSDALTLVDATGGTFAKADLRSVADGDRKLTFVVPRGAAVGNATLRVGKSGDGGNYDVGLNVGRFAVAIDAQGKVEALPLPGSNVARAELQAGSTGTQVSISPSGGQLVTLIGNDVKVFNLGREITSGGAGLIVNAANAVAATSGGAVVGTDGQVLVLSFKQGAGTQQDASFVVGNVRSVAVDPTSSLAVALSYCDTDSDNVADSDCVWPITLAGSASQLGTQIVIDGQPSATQISLATVDNGGSPRQLVVVADRDRIHGIVIDGAGAPITSFVPWPGGSNANPIAIDAGRSTLGPLFAVADADNNRVQTVGFDGTTLKPVSTITVAAAPVALSYGRGSRLYVAAGNKLYFADVGASNEPTLEDIGVSSALPVKSLAVQK